MGKKRNRKAIVITALIMLAGILLVLTGLFGGWFTGLFYKDFDYKNIKPEDLGKEIKTDIKVYYDPDYSPDKYLDEQTAMVAKTVKRFGITAEIKKEGTVTMGGKEYSKVMVHLSGNGPEQYVAYYARKVDDKVIVVLQACNMNDFEKMVEKG